MRHKTEILLPALQAADESDCVMDDEGELASSSTRTCTDSLAYEHSSFTIESEEFPTGTEEETSSRI